MSDCFEVLRVGGVGYGGEKAGEGEMWGFNACDTTTTTTTKDL